MAGYSEEEIKLIGGWLTDDLSAAKIAEQLSIHRHAFVSRNAIIGIVHRDPSLKKIGLGVGNGHRGGRQAGPKSAHRPAAKPQMSPNTRQAKQHPKDRLAAKEKKESRKSDPGFVVERIKPLAAEAAAYDLASRRVALTELGRHDCRFAVNDAAMGEPHLFCGAVTEGGSPYCRHHSMRAFNGRTHIRAEPFFPKRVALLTSVSAGGPA